jgi:hypothetical protein
MSIESNKTDEGSCASVPAATRARPKDGKAAERADPPVSNPRANVRENKRTPFCGTTNHGRKIRSQNVFYSCFRLQTTHILSLPHTTLSLPVKHYYHYLCSLGQIPAFS